MKGVIAGTAPELSTVDISHGIPAGDIHRGAITLWQVWSYFPAGTIFLCVVDPGVGSSRRPILVLSRGYSFIGPDNGLFSYAIGDEFEAWELKNPSFRLAELAVTFHGRDLFAPAAAYHAAGIKGEEFGPSVDDLVRLPYPNLETSREGHLLGEVLFADHFGNLLTSLGLFRRINHGVFQLNPWVPGSTGGVFALRETRLQLKDGRVIPWVNTFTEVPENRCAFLVGSSGLIEIVANRRSAAEMLGYDGGEMITLLTNGES
jgi:S-adenosyl-L-methionine hydrolase (adenosine-forming)